MIDIRNRKKSIGSITVCLQSPGVINTSKVQKMLDRFQEQYQRKIFLLTADTIIIEFDGRCSCLQSPVTINISESESMTVHIANTEFNNL